MADAENSEEERLRREISARPEVVGPRAALALHLHGQSRFDESIELLREGAFFMSGRPDRLEALAEAFLSIGAVPDGIAVLQDVLHLAPGSGHVHARLAVIWASLGEQDKSRAMTAKAEMLGVSIATRDEGDGPTMAFSKHLFDQYAAGFEAHLATLNYTVPQHMDLMLSPYRDIVSGGLVVDSGCGTGLMGPWLRPLAGTLVGIDISPGMLKQAAEKRIYDRLVEADIVPYLQTTADASLITASDVLVYLGDLMPLFAALSKALRPGGLFAASAERHEGAGFVLGQGRRYAHSKTYIYATAAAVGLSVIEFSDNQPRLDRGVPVEGHLFLLARS